MNQSETIGKLAEALAKAQGELKSAVKDAHNPFFKSKYADLASVIDACREAMAKNNLSITQFPTIINDNMVLETTLMHSSGEWQKGYYPIKPVKQDPQSVGSAISYARRYSLAAVMNIAQEDDDGAKASTGKREKPLLPKDEVEQVVNNTLLAIENNDLEGLNETWEGYNPEETKFLWTKFNFKEKDKIKTLRNSKELL